MSLLSFLFGKRPNTHNAIKVLNAKAFKEGISQKKVQLVDVRTPKEYKDGHIKGAKNIDFFSAKFIPEFSKLDKDKPVYLYCRSGARSKNSAKKLATIGFTEIYDLKGGYLNYK
ncbi:rhodanese-like domain-containing protein [Formosa sp. S-31]|uniref:rhodanese-like domain-containing protein n=1 Tax=Formosa sp. S-31 TaxID=2790949 RepID=UPI003EB6AF5B